MTESIPSTTLEFITAAFAAAPAVAPITKAATEHTINNKIGAIKGYAYLMLTSDACKNNPEVVRSCEAILQAADGLRLDMFKIVGVVPAEDRI